MHNRNICRYDTKLRKILPHVNLLSSQILHFNTLKRAPLARYTIKKSIIAYNTHCD